MLFRRLLRNRMRRFGTVAVAVVFLLQTFAVASMPLVSISADEDVVIICTGSGMKTVSLSDLGADVDQDQPDTETMSSGGMCALCPLAHCVALAASIGFLPALDLHTHAPQAPPTEHFVAEGFRTAHQARAPPSNI